MCNCLNSVVRQPEQKRNLSFGVNFPHLLTGIPQDVKRTGVNPHASKAHTTHTEGVIIRKLCRVWREAHAAFGPDPGVVLSCAGRQC